MMLINHFLQITVPAVVPSVPKSSDGTLDATQIWKTLASPEYNGYFALQNPETGKLLTARTDSSASFQGLYLFTKNMVYF